MKIPGIVAIHAIVTDVCRANRGDAGAMDEAWERVRKEWETILRMRIDEGVKYHLVLTVEAAPR